ncbi:PDZ domain-containing protein [bacterium]|nr:PDZ domain-containing protein [bacterium]
MKPDKVHRVLTPRTVPSLRSFGAAIVLLALGLGARSDHFEINKQLEIFTDVYREVHQHYVDPVSSSKLMETALHAMLATLDPYTNYIPESAVEDFRSENTGQYGGIGASLSPRGKSMVVSSIHPGASADLAGLHIGDELLDIDGTPLEGLDMNQVFRLIKGSPGTSLDVTYERKGKKTKTSLKRVEVRAFNVAYSGFVADGVGYIYLANFMNKASDEIKTAYYELLKQGPVKSLVLDLRGNPGGLLDEAVRTCNLFLPKGQEVVRTKGRDRASEEIFRTTANPMDAEIPLVVLINSGSASASEIVAGTLQDLDRAVVLGQRSFGKGLVQQSKPISYGSQIKITIAKYYTPSGRCIQALNYADRAEDGSVRAVPDSVRSRFSTRGGRTVYDGGGIDPDVVVPEPKGSALLDGLEDQWTVFDFANEVAENKPESFQPGKFEVDDRLYARFVDFAQKRGFAHQSYSEQLMARLDTVLRLEGYGDLSKELESLRQQTLKMKSNDLDRQRARLAPWIGAELCERWGYLPGRIEYVLKHDEETQKAVELLRKPEVYSKVLKP